MKSVNIRTSRGNLVDELLEHWKVILDVNEMVKHEDTTDGSCVNGKTKPKATTEYYLITIGNLTTYLNLLTCKHFSIDQKRFHVKIEYISMFKLWDTTEDDSKNADNFDSGLAATSKVN